MVAPSGLADHHCMPDIASPRTIDSTQTVATTRTHDPDGAASRRRGVRPPARRDGKLALLASVPAFAGCSPRELTDLGRVVDVVELGPGVVVQRQGERVDWWSLLVEGTIMATGNGIPEAMLHDGDHLGTGRPGEVTSWTLLTLTPAVLVTVDRRRLAGLVARYPLLAGLPGGGAPRKNVSNSPSTPAPCSVMPPSTTMV